jgi:hypothetical protein
MSDEEVCERLEELKNLSVGWCSYCTDCQPISAATAERALRFVRAVGVPPENVVPIRSNAETGSWVQVEWYPSGFYVEIEVDPAGGFNYMLAERGPDRPLHRVRSSLDFTNAAWIVKLALKMTVSQRA